MAKKKLDKEAERTPSSPSKEEGRKSQQQVNGKDDQHQSDYKMNGFILKYSHNFSSFFFTGAADQSIIDSGSSADLAAVNNQVKNYAGSRGAQLASYLINDCFGVSRPIWLTCRFTMSSRMTTSPSSLDQRIVGLDVAEGLERGGEAHVAGQRLDAVRRVEEQAWFRPPRIRSGYR